MSNSSISNSERKILRDLAKKQLEYSMLPIMKERENLWYQHNDLKGTLPMIHFESGTCEKDLMPSLQCESETGRNIELYLQKNILNYEMIGDDRVIPSWFTIYWNVHMQPFNLKTETKHIKDSSGRDLGHQFLHPIKDLHDDMQLLKPSPRIVDVKGTLELKAFLEDVFGDLLPVKIQSYSPDIGLSQKIVRLMGMENMIYSMVDYPDDFHTMMDKLTKDYIDFYKWQEKEGLLLPNNGNQGVCQGTFGFTNDLPKKRCDENQSTTTMDMWGYMDSQETLDLSPEMFGEFFFQYYYEASKLFGLLNYGCCEPVHTFWENYISKLPNLRKVSISPWCNEEFMGQALMGTNVIYHRKPSPNFVGVGKDLDEEAFRAHILKTIKCAKGCKLEFSFRDVYTLEGNAKKPQRAVQIVRELLEDHWQ
jgi:hypothetical protein